MFPDATAPTTEIILDTTEMCSQSVPPLSPALGLPMCLSWPDRGVSGSRHVYARRRLPRKSSLGFALGLLWVGLGSLWVCFGLAGARFAFALGWVGFALGLPWVKLCSLWGSLCVCFELARARFDFLLVGMGLLWVRLGSLWVCF